MKYHTQRSVKPWYFKKTLCGLVLMIEKRTLGAGVGDWRYYWVKADEADAHDFGADIQEVLIEYKRNSRLLKEIKENNPELII